MKLGYVVAVAFSACLSQMAVAFANRVIEINHDNLVSFDQTGAFGCRVTPDTSNRGDYEFNYSLYQYITFLDVTEPRTILRIYEYRTFGHQADQRVACNRAADNAGYQLARDNLEFHDIKVNNLGVSTNGRVCSAKYLVATLGKEIILSDGSKVNLADLLLSKKAVPCP